MMILMEKTNKIMRVYVLYRVSTKKQVDKQKDDIPMQRIACQEFADEKGWIITKEFYEKGVSGFKVSAEDRDAIQDLKEAALNKEFDVLLVYMFDRLGRIDSETPFVVEWFINQGIQVWSTQEGQQKLEDQTDKLMNYIRYWQANGESRKTSMRLKTRMAQLTAEGTYHGGTVPFGYAAVNQGRLNKKGQPVKDIVVVPDEARIVEMIFDKTLYEGYGSYRLAEYVNSLGVRTHNGSKFTSTTIIRILKSKLYCGYYVSGETVSPKIGELVIIDENKFDSVQEILNQRSKKNDQKHTIALTTKGKAMLSGNIFCGHCGCHLNVAGNTEKYDKKDGTEGVSNTVRYMCYHRARRLNDCDGQVVYSAKKIDDMVSEIVTDYLKRIKTTPKDKALEPRYEKEIQENKRIKKKLTDEKTRIERRLAELSVEIGKSLSGESVFTTEMLSMSINSTKEEMKNVEKQLKECDNMLEEKSDVLNKLDYYYEQFVSWADEFESATMEQKKMIICQLIKTIKVSRGYQLEIEFNISYRQFLAKN